VRLKKSKGEYKMQFPGWWVSGDDKEVRITPYMFDDTELSEASDWKEAPQNEDPTYPHGFIEWDKAVENVKLRLSGAIAEERHG
jgi:hypothetical protein